MSEKNPKIKLKLNPEFKTTIETRLVAWSHDKNSYRIHLELEDNCDNPLSLDKATAYAKLDFLAEDKMVVESVNIDSAFLGQASILLPEKVLGYVGDVIASVYVDFDDKTHDLGSFKFAMKKSSIDDKLPDLSFYVSEWDKALEDFKHVRDEFDGIKDDVDALEQQIKDNDIVTSKEMVDILGLEEELSPESDTVIGKTKTEFSKRAVNADWFKIKGETDDSGAIQRAVDFLKTREINYKDSDMSIYANSSFSLILSPRKYVINKSITNFPTLFNLLGNNAIITSDVKSHVGLFFFSKNEGWKTIIEKITFVKVDNPIRFDSSNLETGRTEIKHCNFIDCTGYSHYIKKRSQLAHIHHNTYHKCDYVSYTENVDRTNFNYNWISEKPRWQTKDATIINIGYQFISENNLWVPYPKLATAEEVALVNNYHTFVSENDHYGGEPGSKTIVNNFAKFIGNTGVKKVVSVNNSSNIHAVNQPIIRLFEVPNKIDFSGNVGMSDNTFFIGVSSTDFERPDSKNKYIKVNFENNISTREINTDLNNIPEFLKPFINNPSEAVVTKNSMVANKKFRTTDKKITIQTNYFDYQAFPGTYLIQSNIQYSSYYATSLILVTFLKTYDWSLKKVVTKIITKEIFNEMSSASGVNDLSVSVKFKNGLDYTDSSSKDELSFDVEYNLGASDHLFSRMDVSIKEIFENMYL